LKDNHA